MLLPDLHVSESGYSKRLDNFTEMTSLEGLKDGTTIEVVEGECQVAHGGGGMEGKESKYDLEQDVV